MALEEYKSIYQNEIDETNFSINKHELVKKAIKRFVTLGNKSNFSIDVFIHGEVDDFGWISKKDIENILIKKIDV